MPLKINFHGFTISVKIKGACTDHLEASQRVILKIAFTAIMVTQIRPNANMRKGVTTIPGLPNITPVTNTKREGYIIAS
jgi:hypothetical protein